MSSTSHRSLWILVCALEMSGCGGGGGDSNAPPPADTFAPETTLSSTPPPRTNLASLPFVVASNEAGITFEARVDAGAYSTVPATFTLSGLGEGPHTIEVRARDAAGNIDASPATFAVVIDRTPPDTTLVSGPAAGPLASSSATFTFTSEANASFESSLDGGAFTMAASPLTLTGLTSGEHTVRIRAMDGAANVDASPATATWTIDVNAPTAAIVFPARFSYTEANSLRIRGASSDAGTIASVSVNGIAAATSDAFAHWTATVPIAAGDNAVLVSTTDALGNTDTAAARVDVANRGAAISNVTELLWDPVRNRAITHDWQRSAIVTIDGVTGRASVLSGATRGTGPALPAGYEMSLALDATNDRVLATYVNHTLFAIDPDTGDRTVISTAAPTADTRFIGGPIACNTDCSLIYAPSRADFSSGFGIFSINIQTGARTLLSGGLSPIGNGLPILSLRGMVFDSNAGAPRLLVLDSSRRALTAVDLGTGDRTIVSSATLSVGLGPDLPAAQGFAADGANGRVLVIDRVGDFDSRVVAINTTSGNRTVLATNPVDASIRLWTYPALDPATARLLVFGEASAVVQMSLPTGDVRRFSDSKVGTGIAMGGNGSLLFDTPTRSLITASWSGVLRVSLVNGDRTLLVPTLLGTLPYTAGHLNFDTRAGIPPSRLIGTGIGTIASPISTLRSFDVTAGTDTYLTGAEIPSGIQTHFPLDGPNGRLLGFSASSFTQLRPFDATTGAAGAAISDFTIGSVPINYMRAIGFEDLAGGARRILIASGDSQVIAVDPATGIRTLVSSAIAGTGPAIIDSESIAVDSAARRALISGGRANALQWVDLVSGNRSMASGVNPDDQTVRGTGPPILGDTSRVVADFANQVAYVTAYGSALLTIDLTTGDRVITSR
jgi:hypothetical protein